MINKLINLLKSKEFQKFFVIGVSAFSMDFILLQIFIRVFNIPETDHARETIANIFSSGISIIYNYTVQRKWAFKSENKNVGKEAGKFILVQLFNLAAFQTLFFSIVNFFLPSWFTKIFVTIFQIGVSFVLYKFFVFSTKKTTEDEVEAAIKSGLN